MNEGSQIYHQAIQTFWGHTCEKNIIVAMELFLDAAIKKFQRAETFFIYFIRNCVDPHIKDGYGQFSTEDRNFFKTQINVFLNNVKAKLLSVPNLLNLLMAAIYLDNKFAFYDIFIVDNANFNAYSSSLSKVDVLRLLQDDVVKQMCPPLSVNKKLLILNPIESGG